MGEKPVAELPRVDIETTYQAPVGGKTWNLTTAEQLKKALSDSAPGDVIVIAAKNNGVQNVITGSFHLPAKSNPNNKWIYIISSDLASLPEGTRVDPGVATAHMPKLVTPGVAPVFTVDNGASVSANYYRLAGLEMTAASNYPMGCGVTGQQNCMTYFIMSTPWAPANPAPDHIFLDRIYAHGGATQDLQGAIQANWSNTALIDSYVSDVHIGGFDSSAIGAFHTPGPFKITNNYLEAAGENIIFGGSGQNNNPWVPSDITITGNHLYKPLSWVEPSLTRKMVVKNHFEVKSGQRILFDSNVLENVWLAGQTGSSILLTVRTCQSGDVAVDNDITITNNVLKNVVRGISISASDDGCGIAPYTNCHNAGEEDRINISNNLILFFDPTAAGGSTNFGLVLAQSLDRINMKMGMPKNIVFQHNTMVPPASGYSNPNVCKWSIFVNNQAPTGFAPAPHLTDNIWIQDNVLCRQPSGDGGFTGMRGLNLYYPSPNAPANDINARFKGNVMYVPAGDKVESFPPHNYPSQKPLSFNQKFELANSPASVANSSDKKPVGFNAEGVRAPLPSAQKE